MNMQFDTSPLKKDFSTTGVKLEGPWENDRNRCYKQLIKDVIKEVFEVDESFVGHHIVYEIPDKIQGALPQEIPSLDTLWFEHSVAKKLWGNDGYLTILRMLASEPVETRDQLFANLYYGRNK